MAQLSIIIPYYNEPTLLQIIDKIYNIKFQNTIQFEVVVVDDGSTDGTTSVLEEQIHNYKDLKLIKHKLKKGKGAAIKTGLSSCRGDLIIIQDADLEYNPAEIPNVLQPIIDGKTKVCYGSRHLSKEQRKRNFLWFKKHVGHALFPYLGGRLITIVCDLLFWVHLTDVLTCYKAFQVSIIQNMQLKNNGFEMEGELTSKILRKAKIMEVPISFSPRSNSEGKKIRWQDGFKIIYAIIKYRFSS